MITQSLSMIYYPKKKKNKTKWRTPTVNIKQNKNKLKSTSPVQKIIFIPPVFAYSTFIFFLKSNLIRNIIKSNETYFL